MTLSFDAHDPAARADAGRWRAVIRSAVDGVVAAGTLWSGRHCGRTAAALAFYTLFSLAPILVIATAVAGAVWGQAAVEGRLVQQLAGLVGPEGGRLIQQMLSNAHQSTLTGWAARAGLVAVLLGASAVFAEMRAAFEDLWRAPQEAARDTPIGHVMLALLAARVRGLAVVVGIGFVLLASLAASSLLVALSADWLPSLAPWPPLAWLLGGVAQGLSLLVTATMLLLLFEALLPVALPRSHTLGVALAGAVLFEAGKGAVSLYLGHSALTSSFGAAGSMAVLLVWLYVAACVVLLCAVLLRVLDATHAAPSAGYDRGTP